MLNGAYGRMLASNLAIVSVLTALIATLSGVSGNNVAAAALSKNKPERVGGEGDATLLRKIVSPRHNHQENEIFVPLNRHENDLGKEEDETVEQHPHADVDDVDDSVFGNTGESFFDFANRRANELKEMNKITFDRSMSQCPYAPSSALSPSVFEDASSLSSSLLRKRIKKR